MSQRKVISTKTAPAALGPYSQGVGAGTLVFASGQLPLTLDGAMPATIEEQTRLSLANLAAVLEAGGASLATILKTTVFLKNMDDFAKMNAVYAEHFTSAPPARSTIEVARLPRDALVEIEAIALTTGS